MRDWLLGEKPQDFDLATNATPDQIISMAPQARIQGKAFPVVVVLVAKRLGRREAAVQNFEISSFVSIEKDVLRRDFTINALYYDLQSSSIIDLVGGRSDLQNRLIRTIRDPVTTLARIRLEYSGQ